MSSCKTVIPIIFSILLCVTYSDAFKDVKGYYWRDYYGDLPDDAFPGGLDLDGNPTYIGQTFERFLIPSKIYPKTGKAYHEIGLQEVEGKQVKILCTQHPEQLIWIPTDDQSLSKLTNVRLILGGYEPDRTTYIGRARSNGELLIGKVLSDNTPELEGLWTTSNGRGLHFTKFEVLSYNANIKKVVDSTTISNSVQPASCVTKQILINYYL